MSDSTVINVVQGSDEFLGNYSEIVATLVTIVYIEVVK